MKLTKNTKVVSLLLILTLLVGVLSGCGKKEESTGEGMFNPGVYEGEGQGHNGLVKVEVEVSEDEILRIDLLEHEESEGIADAALENIPKNIIDAQSLGIDTVTGATMTSNAILEAVEDALVKAGADIEKLKVAVDNTDGQSDEEKTTDVVVVGAGAAGLSAALEAANAGAKVILVEKLAMTGGSTARSGGKILASGTKQQEKLGIEDNAELFYEYLMEIGENKVDKEKIKDVAENSVANLEWLESNGVVFSDDIEELHPSRRPERGHYVKAQEGEERQDGHGWAMTEPLEEKAKEAGVEILLETPAKELIKDGDKIVGVICEDSKGSKITINAKSVVLATGGYDFNDELLKEYSPLINITQSTGVPSNTGDGFIMAKDAGAKIEANGGAILLYLDAGLGLGEVGGLYVDTQGERFMDETDFWFKRTKNLIDRNQTGMFYITDESGKLDTFDEAIESGLVVKADTIEELGSQLGMTDLKVTVDRYNELCAKGQDEDFNKNSEYLKAIENGPFYGVTFIGLNSGTIGGPVTDIKGQVVNEKNEPIEGLYAAGEVGNGDLMYQEYPGSGTSIAMCVHFGRISGQEAAKAALGK